MKKRIVLYSILLLELLILVLFAVSKINLDLANIFPFNFCSILGTGIMNAMKGLASLVQITKLLGEREVIAGLIALVITNILFIVIYFVAIYFIGKLLSKRAASKRKDIVPNYELTNLERERLDPDNFKGGFPYKRVISLIIPLFVIFLFVIARFDKTICEENGSSINGILNIFPKFESFFDELFKVGGEAQIGSSHTFWSQQLIGPYINSMKFLNQFAWVEYIFIALVSIAVLFVWYLLFTGINLLIKDKVAERKAKIATKDYINKMEKREYRLRKNYVDDTSVKADEFLNFIEQETKNDAREIAKIKLEKDSTDLKEEKVNQEYLEEIGDGVHSVESNDKQEEIYKPFVEREIKYITDEDVDIVLEEEPVIEVVQDNEQIDNNVEKTDVFFEKYILEEEPSDVGPLVDDDVSKYVESVATEKEEVEETPIDPAPLEEAVIEAVEPVEEVEVEEEPKEKVIIPRKSGKEVKVPSFKELQELQEEGQIEEVVVEEVIEEPVEVVDERILRLRNARKKAHTGKEQKIPSFKEQAEEKARLKEERRLARLAKKEAKLKELDEQEDSLSSKGTEKKIPSFKEQEEEKARIKEEKRQARLAKKEAKLKELDEIEDNLSTKGTEEKIPSFKEQVEAKAELTEEEKRAKRAANLGKFLKKKKN